MQWFAILFASDIPERGVDRRYRELGNAPTPNIMDMSLRVVEKRVYILAVSSGTMRCQVMTDHRGDRFTAAPAGIRVAGSVRTVAQPDGRRDQFKMGMVTVLGIRENFLERNLELFGVDALGRGIGGPPSG